jgi:hypothetical protein
MKLKKSFQIWKFSSPIILIIFLVIGLLIYKDYGISWDEYIQRTIAIKYIKYIIEFLNLDIFFTSLDFKNVISFDEWRLSGEITIYYGVFFELPLLVLEFIFLGNSGDEQQIYQLRHLVTFLTFMLGVWALHSQAIKIFKSNFLGIVTIILLLLSPRIFAEAFYNSKDIIFMSFVSFSMLTLTNLIYKINTKNILLHSLIVAFAIDIRVMAIFFMPLTLFIFFLKFINKKLDISNLLKTSILFLLSNIIFVIIFFPVLWESPIANFMAVFQNMSGFPADTTMLYMGGIVNENNLPWHYIPVWILVTTPPLIILLFFTGIIFLLINFFKNKFTFNDENKIILLVNFLIIIGSISAVIILESTLYNGWRHMYFVYPSIIIISVYAFFNIFEQVKKKIFGKFIFITFFLFFILNQVNLIIKSHPLQNLYFNFIAGKDWRNKFDLDYWGLANHIAIKDILVKDPLNQNITLCQKSYMALKTTLRILNKKEKRRISLQCSYDNSHIQDINNQPDYLIDNYFRSFDIENIDLNNYEIFNELKVFNEIIVTVFKKKI